MLFLGTLFHVKITRTGADFTIGDPQFASRILGAMTQSCYIGTRDIRSRVIRGLYCTSDKSDVHEKGRGQRSKVNVTEVMTRFRTVTPV